MGAARLQSIPGRRFGRQPAAAIGVAAGEGIESSSMTIVDSKRFPTVRRKIPTLIGIGACLVYVWGCNTVQRDFYQASPPEPSHFQALTIGLEATASRLVEAADHLDARPVEVGRWTYARRYDLVRVDDSGQVLAAVLAIQPDPADPRQIIQEFRFAWSVDEDEIRQTLSDAALASPPVPNVNPNWSDGPESGPPIDLDVGSPETDPTQMNRPEPPMPGANQVGATATLSGRWVDLEEAVAAAGSNDKISDLAITTVDRWRHATIFTLRTLDDQPAMLLVSGDRESRAGPQLAEARIGRFGDSLREVAFLKRVREELNGLSRTERLPGAK